MQPVGLPSPGFWVEIMGWQNPAAWHMKFRLSPGRRIEALSYRHIAISSFCLLQDAQGLHEPGAAQREPVSTKALVSYRLPIPDHMADRPDFCRLRAYPELFLWLTLATRRYSPRLPPVCP
jgi:hypothetical protein